MERKVASRIARHAGWALVVVSLWAVPTARAVKIATYNLLNYGGGTDRASHYKIVTNGLQADLLVTQEITASSAPAAFLANVLNAADGPGGYAKATFNDGYDTDNALFYRTAKFSFNANDPDSFKVLSTDLRDINRWKLRLNGYTSPAADIYIYSMHLKASPGYETQRAAEAAVARADANTLPAGSHFIYCGDLNVYTSSEPAYSVQLTGSMANNNGRAYDPINMPGDWHDGSAFALIHTQSPCNGSGCASGGATGGLDDRFDHLLISAALQDSVGFDYVPGTFVAYGNDGQHFNDAIDGGGFNNAVGLTIAAALRQASDHIPVRADFQVPPKGTASPGSLEFGTAIVGATVQRTLTVTNTGNVVLFEYVAPLHYTLPAVPAGFTGPTGPFAAAAGGAGNAHVYTLDTAAAGTRSGNLSIPTDADDNPLLSVSLSGLVLAHARPSITATGVITAGTLDFGSHPRGGFSTLTASAYNYGYSALQASLDVYAAQIAGPDAARFSIVGGFSPATVGDSPAEYAVAFDDAGVPNNTTCTATLTLQTRDAGGLPGATGLASLTFALTARVAAGNCNEPPVDLDGDGDVDLNDFASLQACFNGPNRPVSAGCLCADGDGDADVDLTDFARFQACFNGPNHPPKPTCGS